MTREDLIVLLKEYKENKARLNIKLKELKNSRIKLKYIDSDTNMTSSYGDNQDIHSKNQISDKVSRKVEENDTKRIELENKIEELEEELEIMKVDNMYGRYKEYGGKTKWERLFATKYGMHDALQELLEGRK